MTKLELPILKFKPILKERIWGGTKLRDLYSKEAIGDSIGESWEISAVAGDVSEVAEGAFAGHSLSSLVQNYKESLVGKKNYQRFGNDFPLLIKFIDAKTDLSVQLHPDDVLAKAKHNSFGKTEMWYVMEANTDANIVVGFNREMDKGSYQKHVADKTIQKVLHYEKVTSGDSFFIYPGLIHAIGAGVMIAEIQQTSDITYRIYDYDRKDDQGNTRELHQEEAMDAIDFRNDGTAKVTYGPLKNTPVNLVTCDYFVTNFIAVDQQLSIIHDRDSFVIYMCVAGEASIKSDVNTQYVKTGETVLVPASITQIELNSNGAKLLQIGI